MPALRRGLDLSVRDGRFSGPKDVDNVNVHVLFALTGLPVELRNR